MIDKEKILAGRKAVDAYRTAHSKLYEKGWHKGIPEEHTPLLNIMLGAFKGLGFNTIQEFFDASEELNQRVFKECYRVEGSCCHECHGQKRGCLEEWYQKRKETTQNEALEPLLTIEEAYTASFFNASPKYLPPACTYQLVKIKESNIDWRWR